MALIELGVFWHVASRSLDKDFTQTLPNQLQGNVSILLRDTGLDCRHQLLREVSEVTEAKLNKKERKKLIERISNASGIAQYALEAKMTDEQVTQAANNLDIFLLVKTANTYNRYCQAQKTAEANAKLKAFVNIQNSEIYQVGKWLANALSKNGQERR
ncbi:MAG: hypothetical protein ICV85_01365, partial [Tolypothrix sp. T3-bin4]|nr:hypothetical protein [Tolypothrix sp. T3-bin4]